MRKHWAYRHAVCAIVLVAALAGEAAAQDMLRHVDLSSPQMTEAEMTRDEVLAALAAASPERPADLGGKRLSGLDLSGIDFGGASLRAAYLN